MNRMVRVGRAAVLACSLGACTGFALESTPGGDGVSASLSTGGIAVDPRTETALVMRKRAVTSSDADGGVPGGPVFAIDPDTGSVRQVADLSEFSEIRVAFPRNSVMIFGEEGSGGDRLMRFDNRTLAQTKSVSTTAQYWGTRTSPGGAYVAVADSSVDPSPIHIIEADTLAVHVLPAKGTTLEAMWLRGSDTLVGVVFPSIADTIGQARIVTWSMPAVQAAGFPMGSDGILAGRTIDVTVPNVGFDSLFSYTWVGISPNDRFAAIPVLSQGTDGTTTHELLVIEMATGTIRTVKDAYGPVGFTPDGSTIVSYRYSGTASTPQLVLINTDTLEANGMDIPGGAAPAYFVTREGNDVVVASAVGTTDLVIYDVTNHAFEKLGGPPLGLSNFVSRVGHDELWVVDGGLYRLNFMTAALQSIPLDWTPANIDILPKRDLLVLDDVSSSAVRYFDPKSMTVTRTVTFPGTTDGGVGLAPQTFARALVR